MESLEFLCTIGQTVFKVPSGEMTNGPYLTRVGQIADQVILSTGMSTLDEVGEAIECLCANGLQRGNLILLQCTSAYPTALPDVNVLAMQTLAAEFGSRVGLSDHTHGDLASIVATALGADVIEKHITLDQSMQGPDHQASLPVAKLRSFIDAVKTVPVVLGSSNKVPVLSELENLPHVRRGVYFACDKQAGQVIAQEDLVCLRPENDVSPMRLNQFVGKRLVHSKERLDPLRYEDTVD